MMTTTMMTMMTMMMMMMTTNERCWPGFPTLPDFKCLGAKRKLVGVSTKKHSYRKQL